MMNFTPTFFYETKKLPFPENCSMNLYFVCSGIIGKAIAAEKFIAFAKHGFGISSSSSQNKNFYSIVMLET